MSLTTTSLFNRLTGKAKFRHMQVLVKLMELGSMGRTAADLGMTQPAVSQIVGELEALVEARLFLRHARGVEPTQLARDLLPVARRISGCLAEGADAVVSRIQHDGGLVRVAATATGIGGLLYTALPTFAALRPDIKVQVMEISGRDPLELITTDECDILCFRELAVTPEGWSFETCLDDDLIVVCGVAHPFAKKRKISMSMLADASWIINRVGSMVQQQLEAFMELAGGMRRPACQVITHIPSLTWSMLEAGQHLAMVPRQAILPWLKAGILVELETEATLAAKPVGFLWQPERASLAVSALAAHMKGMKKDD